MILGSTISLSYQTWFGCATFNRRGSAAALPRQAFDDKEPSLIWWGLSWVRIPISALLHWWLNDSGTDGAPLTAGTESMAVAPDLVSRSLHLMLALVGYSAPKEISALGLSFPSEKTPAFDIRKVYVLHYPEKPLLWQKSPKWAYFLNRVHGKISKKCFICQRKHGIFFSYRDFSLKKRIRQNENL